MKIVGFLQNMWVRDPERVKRSIARYGEDCRMRYMEYALFAGCLTGRRLKKAFGEDVCDEIIWEETTREIAGDPKTIFPAQPEHIRKVIETHKPDVVIAFGKIATDSVFHVLQSIAFDVEGPKRQAIMDIKFIAAPHPAARQADVPQQLTRAADELTKMLTQPGNPKFKHYEGCPAIDGAPVCRCGSGRAA